MRINYLFTSHRNFDLTLKGLNLEGKYFSAVSELCGLSVSFPSITVIQLTLYCLNVSNLLIISKTTTTFVSKVTLLANMKSI